MIGEFFSILKYRHHKLLNAHGLSFVTPNLCGWEAVSTPGALTHTKITWALLPIASQVSGVTPWSPLCAWCCTHSSWRGARQSDASCLLTSVMFLNFEDVDYFKGCMYYCTNQPLKNVCTLFGSIHFSKATPLAPRWWGSARFNSLQEYLEFLSTQIHPLKSITPNLFYKITLKQKRSNLLYTTLKTY